MKIDKNIKIDMRGHNYFRNDWDSFSINEGRFPNIHINFKKKWFYIAINQDKKEFGIYNFDYFRDIKDIEERFNNNPEKTLMEEIEKFLSVKNRHI